MTRYFKADPNYKGDNWLIAWFGVDGKDNKEYNLTTNFVRASELSTISAGARGDCELVANLLNWYHNTPSAERTINSFVKKLKAEEE